MMAMSLYGGDQNASAASAYHAHPLHHGRLARNPVELGARSLPRPRRKRRKSREKEKPLYPSVAAVEEAVPEAIISFQDNGTLEIRYEQSNEEEEEMTDEDDNVKMEGGINNNSLKTKPRSLNASRRRSSSSTSSENLNRQFRKLSVKRKPVASTPWPMDDDSDDPLGGTALTLAPRRKVSRHASRDSQHSFRSTGSCSTESGDSVGSNSRRHRRTATFDSMEQWQHTASPVNTKSTSKSSSTPKNSSKGKSRNSSSGSALKITSKAAGTSYTFKKSAAPLRRLKSWHDDEKGAEKRAQELEIEPGLFLPLRGSDETLAAINTGFVEEIFCQACDIELICIADASFCVCPDCKCVSPVDGIASLQNKSKSAGSVGLGLKASSQR